MRTIYFVGAMAFVATLGYIYAPRFINSRYEPIAIAADEPKAADPAPSTDMTPAPKSPVPIPAPTPPAYNPEGARPTPEPAAPKTKHARAKTKKKKKKSKKGETAKLTGQVDAAGGGLDDAVAEQQVADATGLTPAASDAPAAPATRAPRAGENKVQDRWIPGLSGADAHLAMGKKSNADGCAEAYANCERKAPKDAILAGVVKRVNPSQPMEGKIVEGSYLEDTPAVYVK